MILFSNPFTFLRFHDILCPLHNIDTEEGTSFEEGIILKFQSEFLVFLLCSCIFTYAIKPFGHVFRPINQCNSVPLLLVFTENASICRQPFQTSVCRYLSFSFRVGGYFLFSHVATFQLGWPNCGKHWIVKACFPRHFCSNWGNSCLLFRTDHFMLYPFFSRSTICKGSWNRKA